MKEMQYLHWEVKFLRDNGGFLFYGTEIEVQGAKVLLEFLYKECEKGGRLLLSNVIEVSTGKPLWKFQEEKDRGFRGEARVYKCSLDGNEKYVIGLLYWSTLERVIPIEDLLKMRFQVGKDVRYLGGHSPVDTLKIKKEVSDRENLKMVLTKDEEKAKELLEKIEASRQEELQKMLEANAAVERALWLAERRRKEENRIKRYEELISRKRISVISPTGVELSGIPVVGEEWHILQAYTHVVLFKRRNPETGEFEEPVEYFRVKKSPGGRPDKDRPISPIKFLVENPLVSLGTAYFLLDEDLSAVQIFEPGDIQKLQAKGLNGGTPIAVGPNEEGKYEIWRFEKGDAKSIGFFEPL